MRLSYCLLICLLFTQILPTNARVGEGFKFIDPLSNTWRLIIFVINQDKVNSGSVYIYKSNDPSTNAVPEFNRYADKGTWRLENTDTQKPRIRYKMFKGENVDRHYYLHMLEQQSDKASFSISGFRKSKHSTNGEITPQNKTIWFFDIDKNHKAKWLPETNPLDKKKIEKYLSCNDNTYIFGDKLINVNPRVWKS